MDNKKKVAIVYHYLAHYRLPVFKELLKSEDIEFHFISAADSDNSIKTIDPNIIDDKSINFIWHFVKNIWFKGQLFLWQKGLFSTLRRQNYDAVIFLGSVYFLSTWFCSFYLKLKKTPILYWTHGVTSDSKGLKWKIRKRFYGLADKVLLYGNNAKEVMINNGFDPKRLTVIFNSLDYEQQIKFRRLIFDSTTSDGNLFSFENNQLPLLLFVGRLTKQKKLDMIVHASQVLKTKGLPVNTIIIGKGPIQEELSTLINENGLKNNFLFYGPCYEEEKLARLLAKADICVSPGEVGLTAITSLGYGTPVITHDDFNNQMPEYEAIEPGYNGDLFKVGSVEDLANTIENWIKKYPRSAKQKISKQCFEVIDEKYNPINQAKLIASAIIKE